MSGPRASRLSHDGSGRVDEPVVAAIHDLARYARAHRLEKTDELLTEIMAILSQGIEESSPRARLVSECRAMRVLRFLCEPRG